MAVGHLSRRGLLRAFGAGAVLVAAPAIVRASSLMPVRSVPLEVCEFTLLRMVEFKADGTEVIYSTHGFAEAYLTNSSAWFLRAGCPLGFRAKGIALSEVA